MTKFIHLARENAEGYHNDDHIYLTGIGTIILPTKKLINKQ